MSRRLAREAAFKALFQIDLGKSTTEQALRYILQGLKLKESELLFARDLVEGAHRNRTELDALIQKYLVRWELQRLGTVDRNLLRLALFEILYRPDIPAAVAINESLELAKRYGCSEEEVSFINGLLDRVAAEFSKGE
ncbi:MAG TPA: transcription antitermination factor NusB [Firmicutes bacterium]|nr:transcription antitermination factor NusB [Bacillota bacterium]